MARYKKPTPTRRVARPGKNARVSEKMQIGLRSRLLRRATLIIGLVVFGLAAVIVASLGLYFKVYADPHRVFNDMINNNLATRGFSKEIVRGQAASGSDEITQIVFTPNILVRDVRQVTSQGTDTSFTVETVANTYTDYLHYLKIESKSPSGEKIDYSRVYPLWIKNSEETGSQAQLVNSAFFGATLFGNLDPASRQAVSAKLMPAYSVDYKHIQKNSIDARRVYTYNVTVQLKQYAAAARLYAADLGLPIADRINPAIYGQDAKLHLMVTVDVLSRQLRKVEYIDQGITETYSGYGTAPEISLPAKTVTPEKLTQTINALQR